MRYIAYHRTSTKEQSLDRGIMQLRDWAAKNGIHFFKDRIYTDQSTGTDFERPGYQLVRELLDEGDALVITEIDRLGRTKEGTMEELRYFQRHHIRVMVLELPTTLADYSGMGDAKIMWEMINNILIEVYTSLAEAENQKRRKRQKEGIEAMKRRGDWDSYGRPRKMTMKKFAKIYERVLRNEITATEAMTLYGISNGTYYNYRSEYEKLHAAKNSQQT